MTIFLLFEKLENGKFKIAGIKGSKKAADAWYSEDESIRGYDGVDSLEITHQGFENALSDFMEKMECE